MMVQYHTARITPSEAVYGCAECIPFTTTNFSIMNVQVVSMSAAGHMDVHGVSLSTASSVIVQGTSFHHSNVTVQSITCSLDVQSVAKCYINASNAQL
jgi:hypothetical protein